MNTFIVYSDKKIICSKLHINLWNSRRNNIKYLDFGFMINKNYADESIKIVTPFKVKQDDIVELNTKILKDVTLCKGIFNAVIKYEHSDQHSAIAHNYESDTKFDISTISDIAVNDFDERCSEIKLKIPKWNEDVEKIDKYLRLRINAPNTKSFIEEITPLDHSFSSAFVSNEVIDFRINDIKLANDRAAQILSNSHFYIDGTHFLYMIDADEQVTLASGEYTSRFIEHKLWGNYLEIKNINHNMIAYHLKIALINNGENSENEKSNKKNRSSFVFMIKNQIRRISWFTIIQYIIIVLILGICSNYLKDFIPGVIIKFCLLSNTLKIFVSLVCLILIICIFTGRKIKNKIKGIMS